MPRLKRAVAVLTAAAVSAGVGAARDRVQIAGSSTVLPYATIVAESFAENSDFPTPVVESGGSASGLKKFCEGTAANTIDIANASRRMREAERAACRAAGVDGIIELRIGYDGIVFASDSAGAGFAFTPADLHRALAAEILRDGSLVANPFTHWNQVNPALPAQEITAFVPGSKHGTREVFDRLVIAQGCKDSGAEQLLTAARGAAAAARICTRLRTDGRAVEIDGDYSETLARIGANPAAIGVFGLAFYQNNADRLRVATMDGVTPSAATIAATAYPLARPLYLYVKTAHLGVVPGLADFVRFFLLDDIAGPQGPLAAYGLVADPELAATRARVADEIR